MSDLREKAELISRIVERIRPALADHSPDVQGAALADLLAIWLAGHQVAGDEAATRSLRATLLTEHCFTALQLVSINAKMIGTEP